MIYFHVSEKFMSFVSAVPGHYRLRRRLLPSPVDSQEANDMKTRNTRKGRALLALAWLAAAGTVQASQEAAGRFVMIVYEDMAQGRAVLEGSSEEMIDLVTKGKVGANLSFAENINLCVALTHMKRIAEATEACDAAVSDSHQEARRNKRMMSPAYKLPRDHNDAIVMALTNRGVLHALAGERDEARELFEEALDLQSRRTNSRLRTSTAGNLALLDADVIAAR
jgi:tetratricopeptide (TPR) repeat protein